jgi:hypothetical protein
MPRLPLGTLNFGNVSVSVGLEFEGNECAVHVRISWCNAGVALVVIALDRNGQTYRLLVPASRVRPLGPGQDLEDTFTLHPLPLPEARQTIGHVLRARVTTVRGTPAVRQSDTERDPARRTRQRID